MLDSNSNYVKEADISVLLKEENQIESHLDSEQIIKIAKKFNVDAIHLVMVFYLKRLLLPKNVMMKTSFLLDQTLNQLNLWGIRIGLEFLLKI